MCCPFSGTSNALMASNFGFGIKVLLFIWVVFVPIVITSRLEKIIKLLQEKK